MQRLGEAGVHFHLARANRLTSGAPEGRQEVVSRVAIGDLHGPRTERQTGELVLRLRHLSERVEHHLGALTPDPGLRKIVQIVLVRGVRLRGALVGRRVADVADKGPEIVLVFPLKFHCKGLQQFRIRRRVADAHIVDRINDPHPEEVRPNQVRDILREVSVLRRSHPVCHHFASILAGDVGGLSSEELGRHVASTDEVLHLAAAAVIDDLLAGINPLLAPDLREERRPAVVVVHRPAIEGVVVTLGTLEAHSHEDLGHVLGKLQRVALHLVEVGRRRRETAALGREHVDHDFVEGTIRGDLVAKPSVIKQGGLVGDAEAEIRIRPNLEQLGPFHHPHLGELLPLQEFVDHLAPLRGILVRHEGSVFFDRRKLAHRVDVDATQELLVRAQPGRNDAELMKLIMDETVDVVVLRHLRPGIFEILRNDDGLDADRVRVVAGHDESLTALSSGNQSARRYRGGGFVVGHEDREIRHIAIMAIRKFSAHRELLGRAGALENEFRRIKVQGNDLGHLGCGALCRAVRHPFDHGLVGVAALLVEFATRVRHGLDRFLDEKRLFWDREIDAVARHFTGEPVMVTLGIITEE